MDQLDPSLQLGKAQIFKGTTSILLWMISSPILMIPGCRMHCSPGKTRTTTSRFTHSRTCLTRLTQSMLRTVSRKSMSQCTIWRMRASCLLRSRVTIKTRRRTTTYNRIMEMTQAILQLTAVSTTQRATILTTKVKEPCMTRDRQEQTMTL